MGAWRFFLKHVLLLPVISVPGILFAGNGIEGRLIVLVQASQNQAGTVRVCVFSSSQGFPHNPQKAIACKSGPGQNETRIEFEKIPYGKIAVSAYQDSNENGHLDKGLFGIPKEPVGVSRGESGPLRRPRFEESLVDFNSTETTIPIRLRSRQNP